MNKFYYSEDIAELFIHADRTTAFEGETKDRQSITIPLNANESKVCYHLQDFIDWKGTSFLDKYGDGFVCAYSDEKNFKFESISDKLKKEKQELFKGMTW